MPKRILDEQYYAALVQRIRAGEEDAFAELYANTWADMARYADYILKNADLVPDVLQEIYISVYKNIDKLKVDTLLIPWMRQITYRQCIDMLRRTRAEREVSVQLAPEGYLLDKLSLQELFGGSGPGDVRAMQARELRGSLVQALKALPARDRQAFLLRYEYDLQLGQIADFLGCSLATAKRSIAAARDLLRQELATLKEYA